SESLLPWEGRRRPACGGGGGVRLEASGNAVGHIVARVPAPSLEEDVEDSCELPLDSTLGRPKAKKLWLLSVRLSSELLFLLSTTWPPPAMTTGFTRSIRNGSTDRALHRLSCEETAGAVAVRPRVRRVAELPLRRLTAPMRPYPS